MARPIKRDKLKTNRSRVIGRKRAPRPPAAPANVPVIPDPAAETDPPLPPTEKTFGQVFQGAFQSCMKMWPLFLVQLLVALMNLAMLGVVLLVGCWPLIQSMAQSFGDLIQNPDNYDPQDLSDKLFSLGASDTSWLAIFLGLAAFYLVWALILESLANGAIYGGFWRNLKEGKAFSLGGALNDSLGLFLPYLGSLALLLLISLGLVGGYRLIGMAGIYLLKAFHLGNGMTLAIGLVAGIPYILFYLVLVTALWVYSLAVKSWVGRGKGVFPSLALGWSSLRFKGWRFTKGIVLSLAALAALFIVTQLFLVLTLFIPLIGFLSFFGILFSSGFFLIFLILYLSSLSVSLLDEVERPV